MGGEIGEGEKEEGKEEGSSGGGGAAGPRTVFFEGPLISSHQVLTVLLLGWSKF